MRRGGRDRSYPHLISVMDWGSRSRGSRDVSSGNSRCSSSGGSRGRVCDRRRGCGDWSWRKGLHARPVAGTISTTGLRHNFIGRRMERMGRKEGFCSRGFSSEEGMGNEFK